MENSGWRRKICYPPFSICNFRFVFHAPGEPRANAEEQKVERAERLQHDVKLVKMIQHRRQRQAVGRRQHHHEGTTPNRPRASRSLTITFASASGTIAAAYHGSSAVVAAT